MVRFSEKFQLFSNTELGSVRTLVDQEGDPWFVAIDVCKILEIANARDAVSRLDQDEKEAVGLTDALKNQGNNRFDARINTINLINESGLFSLIFGSRKPIAKPFKRWITHDVIPSIRKNGGYIWGQENLQQRELEFVTAEIQKLQAQVSKFKKRWHELIAENNSLKKGRRELKKENKRLKKETSVRGKEIDDLWTLWDSTQQDFEYELERHKKAEARNIYIDIKPKTRIVYIDRDGFFVGEKLQ